jgi:lipid II:glycine glycyltransferase (peptidoglycan interpeptide bridge formation enzyme)
MHLVRELDGRFWRRFVEEQPRGNVFHTPEMFQAFAHTKGYRPELWAVVDDASRPLALMIPVEITLLGGPLHWVTTRAVAHGSVLCAPGEVGQQALSLLLQAYKRGVGKNVLFTELRNLADMSDLHPLLNASGFLFEEHMDFLIDLSQTPAQVLQSIGPRTRKKIRRGLRDGIVRVSAVAERGDLGRWYEILDRTYRRAQVPLVDRSLFEAAFDHLAPKNMARFLLAEINGRPAACSLELPYKTTIYGWYGGSDRQFSKFYPNEMLNWHIMEWGIQNGYTVYDFGGAGKPDEEYGVRDFKAKFGGQLVHWGRYVCVHAPLRLKLSKLAFNLYQRLLAGKAER